MDADDKAGTTFPADPKLGYAIKDFAICIYIIKKFSVEKRLNLHSFSWSYVEGVDEFAPCDGIKSLFSGLSACARLWWTSAVQAWSRLLVRQAASSRLLQSIGTTGDFPRLGASPAETTTPLMGLPAAWVLTAANGPGEWSETSVPARPNSCLLQTVSPQRAFVLAEAVLHFPCSALPWGLRQPNCSEESPVVLQLGCISQSFVYIERKMTG